MIKFSYKKNLEAWHNLNNPKDNPTRVDGKRDNVKGILAEYTRYTALVKRFHYNQPKYMGQTSEYGRYEFDYFGEEYTKYNVFYKFVKTDHIEMFYKNVQSELNYKENSFDSFIKVYIKNNVSDII